MIARAAEETESTAIAANEGAVTEPQSVPGLMNWANEFNVGGESWILDGALQTLSFWRRNPDSRASLDLRRFATPYAVDTLSEGKETLFRFEYPGWDPQFERWHVFRRAAVTEFEKQLQAYEKQQRSLMESQGAVRARRRYSIQNLKWFALYQLAGRSTMQILEERPDLKGDPSTVLKGIKTAAELLQWKTLRSGPKTEPSNERA